MYYRQITRAAQVIQSNYRNYCEHKRFKKSINQEVYTLVDGNGQQVNSFTCNYSDCDQMQCKNSREGTPFSGLKYYFKYFYFKRFQLKKFFNFILLGALILKGDVISLLEKYNSL
jgi:hypothetical protein